MNSYLSRAEKEAFVRLTSLAGLQEQIIKTYSAGNNADKDFLKLLRTSKTWLMKALDYRVSFLDESAAHDLARQVAKLDLIFVPKDKARKEYELLKEVKSHIHMTIEDFEDWYCEVIEYTCKTCTREDYKACAMRRVMAKHGVFPANPAATNTCQYSYVGADPAELPPPRPPREIAEEVQMADESKVEIYLSSGAQLALEVPQGNMNALPHRNMPAGNQTAVSSLGELVAYKIECKCGAEYICRLGAGRDKARCQKCHAGVYLDKDIKEPLDDGSEATLMTNRYFVPTPEKRRAADSYQDSYQTK